MKLELYLRNKIVKYFNPLVIKDKCEVCGSIEALEVHHVYQFKDMLVDVLNELQLEYKDSDDYTELELLNIKEKMLGKHLNYKYMTLCKNCHLNITIEQNKGAAKMRKLKLFDNMYTPIETTFGLIGEEEMMDYLNIKDYQCYFIDSGYKEYMNLSSDEGIYKKLECMAWNWDCIPTMYFAIKLNGEILICKSFRNPINQEIPMEFDKINYPINTKCKLDVMEIIKNYFEENGHGCVNIGLIQNVNGNNYYTIL